MISFTEKAADKILSIMNEQKVTDDTRVRVGVKGGGCSGFTYTVDFDSRKSKFDLEFESLVLVFWWIRKVIYTLRIQKLIGQMT